jgi:hypothetical protein
MKAILYRYINIFTFIICFSTHLLLQLTLQKEEFSFGLVIEGFIYAIVLTAVFYLQSLNYKR